MKTSSNFPRQYFRTGSSVVVSDLLRLFGGWVSEVLCFRLNLEFPDVAATGDVGVCDRDTLRGIVLRLILDLPSDSEPDSELDEIV